MKLLRENKRRSRTSVTSLAVLALVLMLPLTFAGSVVAATPTLVLLGTADPFAVLAGSGITNTGITTITGDTGSSPTSTETGFAGCPAADCVTQTGANHTNPNPNDIATQNAKTALITAYNNAAGQSPATVPTELAGQTLVAGVYTAASGTFGMTGTLVLDGQDNADSIFIFQTASTLITAATGNVSLIRGAQACNIFWKVGSAATLGAGSTLRGTVMAHDDISLGSAVTVDGRLLAGEQGAAGAVTLIHDTITRPSTCTKQSDIDTAAAEAAAAAQAAATAAAAAAAATAAANLAAANAAAAALAAQNAAAATAAANTAAAAAQVAAAAKTAATAAAAAAKTAATEAAKAAAAKNAAAVKAATAKATAAAKVAAAKAAAAKTAAAKAVAAAKLAKATAAKNARPAKVASGFTG